MDSAHSVDQIIGDSQSWLEFQSFVAPLTETEKGRVYERLVQLYLQTDSQYTTKLSDVWLLNEVPLETKDLLNLPEPDMGIDLIARTHEGAYWSIQAKYRADPSSTLRLGGDGGLAMFSSLSFVTCRNISFGLICSPLDHSVRNIGLLGNRVSFMGITHWAGLDDDEGVGWQSIKEKIDGGILVPDKILPHPFQEKCVIAVAEYFEDPINTRGKIILPCGTGKSLLGFWAHQKLNAKNVLIVVPSLTLVSQTLKTWTEQCVAHGDSPNWFAVCSDDSIGNQGKDQLLSSINDLPFHISTNVDEIAAWLSADLVGTKLTIATYQSGPTLAEAAKRAGISFDLAVMDEAHKTVGDRKKRFAHLLDPSNLPAKYLLFMTATERVFAGNLGDVYTMDDKDVYGDLIYQMSFKAAIEDGIISDYEIRTVAVSSAEVKRLWDENAFVRPIESELDDLTARSLAAHLAVKRVIDTQGVRRIISFHRSLRAAKDFRDRSTQIFKLYPENDGIECFYVSGDQRMDMRTRTIDSFAEADVGMITNARCLNEGVDIPSVDCILFADPRRSIIDIVQAVGRVLRKSPGKEKGTIVIPVIVPEHQGLDEFQQETDFKSVISVIRAIATQDERIVDQVKTVLSGGIRGDGPGFDIDLDPIVAERIRLSDFAAAVDTRTWDQLKRFAWRPFGEARDFALTTGCQSSTEWRALGKSGCFPFDIPTSPDSAYKIDGWISWGDWLGTGAVASGLVYSRPFTEARKFARALKLSGSNAWQEYCRSGQRPSDIPSNPHRVYRGTGWAGMGDWLGTGNIQTSLREYRSFSDAREFIHSLGLKSNRDWLAYRRRGQLPKDIPTHPHVIYKDQGWQNLGDWLGTGTVAPRLIQYRSFEKAREFARSLNLTNGSEWRKYSKSSDLPSDVPASPGNVYKDSGWLGMGDWLGTGRTATHLRAYRPFEDARTFVRTLGLKNQDEWRNYCKSDQLPTDVPRVPSKVYRDQGWVGMGDWLGTGYVANRARKYRSFESARDFAKSLDLTGQLAWREYCKSGALPPDVPAAPWGAYKDTGWKGLRDWLGR